MDPQSDSPLWTSTSASNNEQQIKEEHEVDAVDDAVLEDSQAEPTSWQLGGENSTFSSGSKLPPGIIVPNADEIFKIPAGPVKRRGRPPDSLKEAQGGSKSPNGAKRAQVALKSKFGRKKKSKRKRLTMTKMRGVTTKVYRPDLPTHPTIPSAHLTAKDRNMRLERLFKNSPAQLVTELRNGSVTAGTLIKDAEEFRTAIRARLASGKSLDDLQLQIETEHKARIAEEETADRSHTENLCAKIKAMYSGVEESSNISSLFINGPADEKLRAVMELVGIPLMEMGPTSVEADRRAVEFCVSVNLPQDFASKAHLYENLNSTDPIVTSVADFPRAIKSEVAPVETKSPRKACDFFGRVHPRDLFQQLSGKLGKNALQRSEKRAVQRARRTAFMENLTEQRVERAFFDYVKICVTQAAPAVAVESPIYHQANLDGISEPVELEEKLNEFGEHFRKKCACRNRAKCEECKDGSPSRSLLPTISNVTVPPHSTIYDHCFACSASYPFEFEPAHFAHPEHRASNEAFQLETMHLHMDFLSTDEEKELIKAINSRNWMEGTTFRRQDYGPVVTFPRQKLNMDKFSGLPHFASGLNKRLSKIDQLRDPPFVLNGLTNIELIKDKDCSVPPRIEDQWMWGNRVGILSLNGNTTVTFSPVTWDAKDVYRPVRVLIPRRSLFLMSGKLRSGWNYSVLSADVEEKQILVILRELSSDFVSGPLADVGKQVTSTNHQFNGKVMKSAEGY